MNIGWKCLNCGRRNTHVYLRKEQVLTAELICKNCGASASTDVCFFSDDFDFGKEVEE